MSAAQLVTYSNHLLYGVCDYCGEIAPCANLDDAAALERLQALVADHNRYWHGTEPKQEERRRLT